jgi:hypothetical protein
MTGLLLEPADRAIAAIARTQYGLIATRQARTAGLQQHHLKQRVASGQLVAVRRGVLRVAGTPACWEQSALGAVLAGGEDTLLSHGAAARGWRANRFAHTLVEIVEPRRCSSALSDIRCHHSVVVQVDRRTVRGLPLTSPERTLCDLSGRMNADQLGRLADEWIRRHLMTADGLAVCAARLKSAHGRRVSVVHRVLESRLPGYEPGDSVFSERVAQLLEHVAGFTDVVREYPVRVGPRTYHIDVANPSVLLAHETDGWDGHRTRSAFYIDRARHARASRPCSRVVTFWESVTPQTSRRVPRISVRRRPCRSG